jgi:hypothetical protein
MQKWTMIFTTTKKTTFNKSFEKIHHIKIIIITKSINKMEFQKKSNACIRNETVHGCQN